MKYILLLCVIATSFVHASGGGRSTTPTLLDQIADASGGGGGGGGNSRGSANRKKRERGGSAAVDYSSPQRALASPGKMGDVAKRLRQAGVDITDSPAKAAVTAELQASRNAQLANDVILELLRMKTGGGKLTLKGINDALLSVHSGLSVATIDLLREAKDLLEDSGGRAEPFAAINLDHVKSPQQMGDASKAKNRGRIFGGHTLAGLNRFERPVECVVFENGTKETVCVRPLGKNPTNKSAWGVDVDDEDILRKYRGSRPFAKQPGAKRPVGKRCHLRMGLGTGEVTVAGADNSQERLVANVVKTTFPFPILPFPKNSGKIVVAKKMIQDPRKGGVLKHVADLVLTGSELQSCLSEAQVKNNKTFVDFKVDTEVLVRDVTKEVHVALGFKGKPHNPFWIWETADCESRVKKAFNFCSVDLQRDLLTKLEKLSLQESPRSVFAEIAFAFSDGSSPRVAKVIHDAAQQNLLGLLDPAAAGDDDDDD